jgi:hypothetical protein
MPGPSLGDGAIWSYAVQQVKSAFEIALHGNKEQMDDWLRDNIWIMDLVMSGQELLSGKVPRSAKRIGHRLSMIKELLEADGASPEQLAKQVVSSPEGQKVLEGVLDHLYDKSGAKKRDENEVLTQLIPENESLEDWFIRIGQQLGLTPKQVHHKRAILLGLK